MSDKTVAHPSTNHDVQYDASALQVQFDATNELMQTFFEWRHKVLTRYLIGVGAIGVFVAWTHDHDAERWLRLAPYTVGLILSVLAALMDRVNQRILDMCYDCGTALEKAMLPAWPSGIFGGLHRAFRLHQRPRPISYRILLATTYVGGGILFVVGSILDLVSSR